MKILMSLFLVIFMIGCQTTDIEKKIVQDMENENKTLKEELENMKMALELKTKEDIYSVDIEPVIINKEKYIVVDKSEIATKENTKVLINQDAAKQSLLDSKVELKDFVGGTSYYDYDKDYQFPIFVEELRLTRILFGDDEYMESLDKVFLSDTTRWEIIGDVLPTETGDRQLLIIKPRKGATETNMSVITSKRLYNFILYPVKDKYQMMGEFRYPYDRRFITSKTKKSEAKKISTIFEDLDPELVSFNYKVITPFFQRKINWIPKYVYDDGTHTYILLPEVVLQKEFPLVFEDNDKIVNYTIDKNFHNLIIIEKLIDSITLRIENKKITIVKKKGDSLNLKR